MFREKTRRMTADAQSFGSALGNLCQVGEKRSPCCFVFLVARTASSHARAVCYTTQVAEEWRVAGQKFNQVGERLADTLAAFQGFGDQSSADSAQVSLFLTSVLLVCMECALMCRGRAGMRCAVRL